MGHFHAENLCKILLLELLDNHFPNTMRKPKKEKLLDISLVANKLVKNIAIIQRALKNIKDEKAIKLITEMMEEKYCANASEGSYSDKGMIEMGVNEIVCIWEHNGIIEKIDNKWKLTEKGLNIFHESGEEGIVIKEIEM